MIEIEKKFILTDEDISRLVSGGQFLGEKTFLDVYFDTPEYSLTKNDMWLRKRGNDFELKIPMNSAGSNGLTQQYQEIEGSEKIREIFAVAPINDFETDIKAFGYDAFCRCATTRRKYQKEGFVIDLDIVTSPDDENFKYQLAEIELKVDSKEDMLEAEKKIIDFAEKNDLKIQYVRGKVLQYLFLLKPDHFKALEEAGVVRER